MGGRGSTSGFGWKSQLRKFANEGKMPGYVAGPREMQSKVMVEIDKLYPMPKTDARIIDQGESVQVTLDNKTSRAFYPSGKEASDAEKRGVLKMLIYNLRKR